MRTGILMTYFFELISRKKAVRRGTTTFSGFHGGRSPTLPLFAVTELSQKSAVFQSTTITRQYRRSTHYIPALAITT